MLMQSRKQPTILIVDDDPQARRLIEKMMRKDQYLTHQAENGQAGVEAFQRIRPDVVLLDAMMPVMDGFEACAHIQKLPGGTRTPVLMITSLDDESSIQKAFNAGAMDYITKPIRWSLLRQRIHRLLRTQKAESALYEREEQLTSVIAHAPVGICAIDLDGMLTLASGRFLENGGILGHYRVNRSIYDAMAHTPQIIKHIQDAQSGQYLTTTIEMETGDRILEYTFSPTTDHHGVVNGALMIIIDITEQHRIEQMKLEVEREKVRILENFIDITSHDFRTPLSTINTSLYLIERTKDDEKQQKHIDILKQQAHHMRDLIEKMLTMSQLDRMSSLDFAPVDLNYLVESALEQCHLYMQSRNAILDVHLFGEPIYVLADADEMARAFVNLIENAINYSLDEANVYLRTYRNGNDATFEIKDNGLGISPKDLPKIFDRFYRASGNRPTATGGSGLGLSITQKIVELHRGRIEVESEVNNGSTFKVLLPLKAGA